MNRINKTFARLAAAATLLAASLSASAATLSLFPNTGSAGMGQTLTVDVRVSGLAAGQTVGLFDLLVDYDSSKLNFNSFTLGGGLGDLGTEAFDLGSGLAGASVRLFELSLLDDLSFQGSSFSLGTISFTTLAAGNASFSFSSSLLGDGWGNEIRASLDKAATVSLVPEPSSLLLLGAALGSLALVRRRRAD